MATALAELEEKVRALNSSDKAALIRVLIGELDGPPEPGVEKAWIAEAKRRHQELLEGREGHTWRAGFRKRPGTPTTFATARAAPWCTSWSSRASIVSPGIGSPESLANDRL